MRPGIALTAAFVSALVTTQVRATDELVPGGLAVVESEGRTRFVSRSKARLGEAPFVLPAPGLADDPTIHGATLTFADVGLVAGTAIYVLAASGWTGLGSPPGSRGYRYRGKDDMEDPDPQGTCRSVLLKERVLRASCKTDASLTPPFADAESIVLAVGAAATPLRYCAELGGRETRNDAAAMRREDAPPPLACPVTECPTLEFLPSAEVAGACWYPAPDTSCRVICGLVGLQYSEATRTFAGSDGTEANCNAVLLALSGGSGATDGDCGSVGLPGLGCVVFTELGSSARCTAPPTSADAAEIGAMRICACR